MSSADQFLQLLEEKDLVSAAVLQAARREIEGASPPRDAVHLSLWLVQGQHITASQAERLLAAVAEKADVPGPKPPIPRVFQPKSPEPKNSADQAGKPDLRTDQAGKPDVRAVQPKVPEPQRPAAAPEDDLDLAPLPDEVASKAAKTKPAKASSAHQDSRAVSPPTSSSAEARGKKSPAAAAKAGSSSKKNSVTAKIGGELESLEDTMKGPLDALIESEALQSTGFDDPTAEMQLNPAVPKKFKLRRFLKNLFRRNKNKSNIVRIKAADPRQVKLVLMSWGVAVVALLALLTSFWAFSPPGTAELRQEAEGAVMAEDYRQAIGVYDKFLKYYPGANDIRLLRSLAELRLAEKNATAAGDWTPAFEVAKTQVNILPKDKDRIDSDVIQKYGIALAKIGEGLAQRVQAHPDKDSVNRLQSVVEMLETNIPEINRPTKMLDEMKGILQHGRQEVAGRQELDQTVEVIRDAVKAIDVQAAYTAYRDFVKSNPERTDDARLIEAMKQVSSVQQKGVKLVRKLLAAVRQERPSGVLVAMPLAVQPVKGELAEGRGKLFFVVEQGTAYGLDAATGKTLWRRFVALDPKLPAVTALPVPVSVTGAAASDVVLCDPVHQELLRVQGTTGELLWRLVLGQPIVAEPVQAGKWLLLLTQDQRLLLIDPVTGESPRYFQLPQAVRLPPVVDAAHGLIFLTTEHSNLIVLGMGQLDGDQLDKGQLDGGQCRQVFHVGHETGKIAAPPAIMGDFLLLPINDAPGDAKIRVFSISKSKEGEPLMPMQTIRVAGSIDTAPVAVGRGAAVVTAQGSLFALDRNGDGNKPPFQVVASKPVSLEEKATHYVLSAGRTFWMADRHLTRYAVHAEEHRIVSQATSDLGMTFVRAPLIDGGVMFQVLQKSGRPGVTVSAFGLEKKESVWQTWLAAPLVTEPTLSAGKLTVVTKSGGIFRAPLDGLKPLEKPWEPVLEVAASGLTKPLSALLPLPGEMFAMTSGDTTQIVIYDPKEQDKQLRYFLSPSKMSVGPGAFAGGLLTPCVNGQVFLLDLEARGEMVEPLQPAVKDVSSWNWRTPIAVDDKLAVLCDGDSRLMVINIGTDTKKDSTDVPKKALSEVASATTKNGLVSPIVVLGNSVYVVDSTNKLLSFELPNLTPGKSQVLGARCVWGPQRVGKLVLVATEKGSLPTEQGRLFAIDERQQVVWESVLGYGPLAGSPYLSGDEIFLSARSGMVWRISAADGKEIGKIDAGCPLGTGPLVVGSRVIIGGHEGSLLEVKKP
ncbi:MAG: PQQ-binding-like beta-propeller repeat protein [Planctomycetota bacterium]